MNKTVTVVQQLVRLGALWIAVCASLVLAVGYTKTGLETLLHEHLPSSSQPQAHAAPHAPAVPVAQQPVVPQPVLATRPAAAPAASAPAPQTPAALRQARTL